MMLPTTGDLASLEISQEVVTGLGDVDHVNSTRSYLPSARGYLRDQGIYFSSRRPHYDSLIHLDIAVLDLEELGVFVHSPNSSLSFGGVSPKYGRQVRRELRGLMV